MAGGEPFVLYKAVFVRSNLSIDSSIQLILEQDDAIKLICKQCNLSSTLKTAEERKTSAKEHGR